MNGLESGKLYLKNSSEYKIYSLQNLNYCITFVAFPCKNYFTAHFWKITSQEKHYCLSVASSIIYHLFDEEVKNASYFYLK